MTWIVFVVAFSAVSLGIVARAAALTRLRDRHPERWKILGRPNPWFPQPNFNDELPYNNWLKAGRHRELNDLVLNRWVAAIRVCSWVAIVAILSTLVVSAVRLLMR